MGLQIFILGVLSEAKHHPYDVKKMLKKNNIDEVSNINDGKLYYNFESLLKQGCIEKVEVIRDENRPEKTVYGITEKGKQVLEQKIYDSFSNFKGIRTIYSSVIFIKYVDDTKVLYLLDKIIQNLKEKIDHYHQVWDRISESTPPSFHLIQEYSHNQMYVDLAWLEKVVDYVKNKQYEA